MELPVNPRQDHHFGQSHGDQTQRLEHLGVVGWVNLIRTEVSHWVYHGLPGKNRVYHWKRWRPPAVWNMEEVNSSPNLEYTARFWVTYPLKRIALEWLPQQKTSTNQRGCLECRRHPWNHGILRLCTKENLPALTQVPKRVSTILIGLKSTRSCLKLKQYIGMEWVCKVGCFALHRLCLVRLVRSSLLTLSFVGGTVDHLTHMVSHDFPMIRIAWPGHPLNYQCVEKTHPGQFLMWRGATMCNCQSPGRGMWRARKFWALTLD